MLSVPVRHSGQHRNFTGSRVDCFELVRTADAAAIEDHRIEMIGPDLDDIPAGSRISASYTVEVAGKNMQTDFESVIERKIHQFLNCIEGVMHTGQRDMIRVCINKADYEAWFRLRHLGEVLYAKIKSEFEAVVDKCRVRIVVDADMNKEADASAAYVVIPPLLYALYAGIGYVRGWHFAPGVNYPYFSLNWGSPAGAFGLSDELPFLGCVWWILILLAFLIAVGLTYVSLAARIGKRIS